MNTRVSSIRVGICAGNFLTGFEPSQVHTSAVKIVFYRPLVLQVLHAARTSAASSYSNDELSAYAFVVLVCLGRAVPKQLEHALISHNMLHLVQSVLLYRTDLVNKRRQTQQYENNKHIIDLHMRTAHSLRRCYLCVVSVLIQVTVG